MVKSRVTTFFIYFYMNLQHIDAWLIPTTIRGRSEVGGEGGGVGKGGGRGGGRAKRESRVCLVVYVEPRLFN